MAFSLCWKAPRSQWSFLQALNSGFPLFPWRTVGSCLDLKMKAYLEENTEVTSSGSLTPEIQLRLLTPRCKFWWERADLWPYSDPYWAIYWPGGQALSRYVSLKYWKSFFLYVSTPHLHFIGFILSDPSSRTRKSLRSMQSPNLYMVWIAILLVK